MQFLPSIDGHNEKLFYIILSQLPLLSKYIPLVLNDRLLLDLRPSVVDKPLRIYAVPASSYNGLKSYSPSPYIFFMPRFRRAR